MKNCYVYIYLRQYNSKHGLANTPFYVGKGTGNRAFSADHAIKVPRDPNRIKFVSLGLSESEAFGLERFLIMYYGRIDNQTGMLRNRTDGGEGTTGHKLTEATKTKMSIVRRGKFMSERHKHQFLAMKEANIGKTFSKEVKEKMSLAKLGKKLSPRTQEHAKNISIAKKGKKQSAEHLAARKRSQLLKPMTKKMIQCEHCSRLIDAQNIGRHRNAHLKA